MILGLKQRYDRIYLTLNSLGRDFMLINSLLYSIVSTGLIVGFIIGFIVLQKVVLEKWKKTISNKAIIMSFILLLLIIITGVIATLYIWGYDIFFWVNEFSDNFVEYLENNLPKFVGTGITLFVSLMFLKILMYSLQRVGIKESPNQRRKKTIAKIMMSVAKYIIVIITLLVVLSIWGLNVGPALTGLGIAGLVIGLGAQKFINDLISGFFIIFEHHFDVGDWIEVQGFMGEVIDIGLKTTKVRDFKGEIKIFNNGSIDPVSNFSVSESLAIADFSIAYKEDVKKTIELLTKELPAMKQEIPELLEAPRVLGVQSLADSGVNLRVVAQVQSMTQYGVQRQLRQRIKEILDREEIEIPFPQLTLHYGKDHENGDK